MPITHLVAHTENKARSFEKPEFARHLWCKIRQSFPSILAVTLMPDHVHLLLASDNPENARQKLQSLLTRFEKTVGITWKKPPPPQIVPDLKHLRRTIRYLALNPCRARLTNDPLSWTFSTYRDLFGAVVNPWISAADISKILKEPPPGFKIRFHAYVSSDPTCLVSGSPLPIAAKPTRFAQYTLKDISQAACASLRTDPTAIKRKSPARELFLNLAFEQGWRDANQLAEICQTHRRTVYYAWKRKKEGDLAAASVCLGDARFRQKCSA